MGPPLPGPSLRRPSGPALRSGMMGLAVRSDAVRGNPVRDLAPLSRKTKGATAVPLERLPELIAKVRTDEELQRLDLSDVLEFGIGIGIGCPVGEVMALRWDVVDLENGAVSIQANVVRARGGASSCGTTPRPGPVCG